MSDEKKDSGFSFENTPGKIGGESQGDEFNFSDIPVLGKPENEKEKKGIFSFDHKKAEQQQAGVQYDEMKEQPPPGQGQDELNPDMYRQEDQAKWDKIAIKKKFAFKLNLSPKLLVIVAVAFCVVLAGGASAFFLLKSKAKGQATGTAGTQGGAKPGKKDPKAEEEARRQAELEKKLAAANAALKEAKYKEALKMFQLLETELWKEKELVILFGEAECYENLKQDDDALKGYTKCVDAGWKENSQPYMRAAKILSKKEKSADAVKCLEKGRALFPTDSPLVIQLAQTYNALGQTDKSAAEFKKITNKSDFPLDVLKLYCSILLKRQEKESARELYIYGSKKFRDLDCFMSAAQLSDKPQDKIDIMNQALNNIEEKKKSIAIMYLTELLMQNGKKDEAAKQLDKIQLGELRQESVVDFLKMLVVSGNLTKFKAEYKKAIGLFPKDFPMHQAVYDSLVENGQDKLAFEIYSEWWSERNETCGGYFYGKSLGAMPDEVIDIYTRLAKKDPDFFEVLYDLGYFYMLKRDWPNSEKNYAECVRLRPNDRSLQQLLAVARIRNGKGDEALDGYEKLLSGLNISEEEKASDLIDIACRLPSPARMEKYLGVLKGNPKYADEYKTQLMKFKLIYGKPDDSDFAEPYPKAARIYHEYYLLSKGRTNEVLLMTVPPDEFPDFWKIFILWRNDKPGWQEGMDALVAKNKAKKDAIYGIIASLWNGKLQPDDAKKHIEKIHPDNETLFYLMIAERYRKDKISIKGKVAYQRAVSDRLNPIAGVADYFSKLPIK
ncbi:MAG TPA: hypothetical protein DCZ94_03045 [Lentisphaeria bacterium]|nr:MAG: hypothetical protein A2X48_15870 [Lentisphaerae bacterium GWF2_49_21]HBC85911.1 hypothetical protein [Lentisphaeria bacterium]